MLGEMFAQDSYSGLSPLVQQQMQQFQQRRRRPAGSMPSQQPAGGGITPTMSRPGGAAGDPGTSGAASMFNAASGNQYGYPPDASTGRTGLGGNLGVTGTFDPSNWNASLPSGDLFGGM